MKRFLTLWKQQIWIMFISPSTYISAFLFLSFAGAMFLLSLAEVSRMSSDTSPMENFLSVFWIPVLFMVPLLTMRSLAEERRAGTLETLMTTSVSAWQIVLSKFLAAYFFYALLWALTIVFPIVTKFYAPQFSADPRMFSVVQTATGYGFVMLSGAMYVAVGIFSSALTRTTIVAAMLSFCLLFLIVVGAGLVAKFPIAEAGGGALISSVADYIQTFRHFEDFSASVIDTRPFFFYISTTLVLLTVTSLVTEAKNT